MDQCGAEETGNLPEKNLNLVIVVALREPALCRRKPSTVSWCCVLVLVLVLAVALTLALAQSPGCGSDSGPGALVSACIFNPPCTSSFPAPAVRP